MYSAALTSPLSANGGFFSELLRQEDRRDHKNHHKECESREDCAGTEAADGPVDESAVVLPGSLLLGALGVERLQALGNRRSNEDHDDDEHDPLHGSA